MRGGRDYLRKKMCQGLMLSNSMNAIMIPAMMSAISDLDRVLNVVVNIA